MYCNNIHECFEEISAYCCGEKTGYPLLVNTENNDAFQDILHRLSGDESKKCIYVSENVQPNGLPNPDYIMELIKGPENYVLVGISQAMMLKSQASVEQAIDKLLHLPIRGYAVVLLSHCRHYLQKFMAYDDRIKNRVVLVAGQTLPLPQITLVKKKEECIDCKPLENMPSLLSYLEKMTDRQVVEHPRITVVTKFSPELFKDAVYAISAHDGIYESLCRTYSDIAAATRKEYGTDEQWAWLAEQIKPNESFSAVVYHMFGTTSDLSSYLRSVRRYTNQNEYWMLWLSLKVFGARNNQYLTRVLQNSQTVDDFEEHIYCDLLEMEHTDPNFSRCYEERKILIDSLPENLPLIDTYCNRVAKHGQNAIYYLTDSSEREEFELVCCLSNYDYRESDIMSALHQSFPELAKYLHEFKFDEANTKLSEKDTPLRNILTRYFQNYKLQKLTNRIDPSFLKQVETFANERPYNKLRPRSSVVQSMDKKGAQLFFFDALGVEYLAYIQAKCKEYDLISEISVCHCELPSITMKNKEFLQFFPSDNCVKIEDLDELKHHSQVFDFRKRPEPIHVFRELEIIDNTLRQIQSQLAQGCYQKAIIVSDHGASRLAVLYNHENQSLLEMDEPGEHSGRCCPVDEDPHIPFAAYEDGYVILANYERFKGSRKANVEAHGGASLEEVVVPVITISKQPDNIEMYFINPVIKLKIKEQAKITLFSNIPLQSPRLCVNGKFYNGTFFTDHRHVQFVMPDLKRSKPEGYRAEVYDGEKNLSVTLSFQIKREGAKEVEYF
jgi:hypothetical protein